MENMIAYEIEKYSVGVLSVLLFIVVVVLIRKVRAEKKDIIVWEKKDQVSHPADKINWDCEALNN